MLRNEMATESKMGSECLATMGTRVWWIFFMCTEMGHEGAVEAEFLVAYVTTLSTFPCLIDMNEEAVE